MNCHEKESLQGSHLDNSAMKQSYELFKRIVLGTRSMVILRITYINKVKLGRWAILFLHRKNHLGF